MDTHTGQALGKIGGKEIFGNKFFVNTDTFQITVRPVGVFDEGECIGNYPRIFVQCNPWKATHDGQNSGEVNIDRVQAFLDSLDSRLSREGVEVGKKRLNRIDIGLNLATKHDERQYLAMIGALTGGSRLKTVDYGETVYNRNKATAFVAYSKRAELKDWSLAPTLRLEYRKLNKKAVESYFDAPFLDDFDLVEASLAVWRQVLAEIEQKPKHGQLVSTETAAAILRHNMESGGRYWLSNTLRDLGLAVILENYTSEAFAAILDAQNVSRERRSDVARRIRRLKTDNLVIENVDLHAEVVDLLAKEVDELAKRQ